MNRLALLGMLGAISGGLGVALGAFGAHGLEGRLSERAMELFQTGVKYQMFHALAILFAAGFTYHETRSGMSAFEAAGWSFVFGTLIFAGTLYAMSFGAPRWLGAITPIGGLLLIAGWTMLAFGFLTRLR